MTAAVTFFLSLLVQAPQDITAIASAYQAIKHVLAAKDVASLDPIFAALNAKTDADVAAFDAAAGAAFPVAA